MNITRQNFTKIVNSISEYFINNNIRYIDTFSYVIDDFSGTLQITWIVKSGKFYNSEKTYKYFLSDHFYNTEQEMIDNAIYLINQSLNNINN